MMKNYALASILAAGLTTAIPKSPDALEVCIGCEYFTRTENSMGAVPLLMEQIAPGRYEARLILEQRYDTDTYRVILREGDTLPRVVGILRRVRPEATLERIVRENRLMRNLLPPLRATYPGERPTASITYTVHVDPSTPTR